MFKCQKCQKVSEPGDQPVRVVVEQRVPASGRGSQIVREEAMCQPCAARFESSQGVKVTTMAEAFSRYTTLLKVDVPATDGPEAA